MDTKVISIRISYEKYEKIILECEAKGITVTEFIERKIAAAAALKNFKEEVFQRIAAAYENVDASPTFMKNSLRRVLNFIGNY